MKKTKSLGRMLGIVIVCIAFFAAPAPVEALSVSSPAAFALDAKTGEALYEKNADTMRPCASLTKLMTAYLVFESISRSELTWDTPITISWRTAELSRVKGHSNVPLTAGESYAVHELMTALLGVSANACAVAFAEELAGSETAFVAMMNDKATAMGLAASFQDASGLSSNNTMSSRSVAILSAYLVRDFPAVLDFTGRHPVYFRSKAYDNTNQMLPGRPYGYAGTDGLKTGTTTPAGYCFSGTAARDGDRVIAVVLGGSSLKNRFGDAKNLFDYGFDRIKNYPLPFKDVSINAWYFEPVKNCTEAGWMQGTGAIAFSPEATTTRAMFVTVLGRMDGIDETAWDTPTSFHDVEEDAWYTSYVAWADDAEIVAGFEDGSFRPHDQITREQMMMIVYNYARHIGEEVDPSPSPTLEAFSDYKTVSTWALDAAAWSVERKWIQGTGEGRLSPQANATRAQLAQLLQNIAAA